MMMPRERVVEVDGNELYEHFRFVADKGQELLRVDKFLVERLKKSSRNRIQQAAEAGVYTRQRQAREEQLPRQATRCSAGGDGSPSLRV